MTYKNIFLLKEDHPDILNLSKHGGTCTFFTFYLDEMNARLKLVHADTEGPLACVEDQ